MSILLIAGIGYGAYGKFSPKKAQPQYQTAAVEKGTLVVAITASGQVSSANSATISTNASGVVTNVFVKDGDRVKVGDAIAELEYDLEGKQRAASAYASYQSAKNSFESAKANLYTSQSDLFTKWDAFKDLAENSTYQNADGSPKTENRTLPEFITTNDNWLASEAKYKIQQATILQSQTALNSAWLSYQQSNSTILAPISGTVNGLSLQKGSVLTAQSSTTGTATSQKVASVKTDTEPTIGFNLTEIDAPKITIGNKATVTFDAFPGKTYTGNVISIDTIGGTSSGVTSYPAVIKLDTVIAGLFSNMSATANIITATKSDVLLVASSAVKTQNGEHTIQVMKNGQPTAVSVEVGLSSDTQTEIVSGAVEGDVVVTNTMTQSNGTGTQTRSVFSTFGGGGAFRGR